MKTFLQNVLRDAPCEYAELRYQETKTTTITFDGKGLKDVGINTSRGCFVRVLNRGSFGTASFEDVDRAREFLEKAIAHASFRKGTVPGLAPTAANTDDVEVKVDRPAHIVPLEEKVSLVAKYNDILLRHPRIPGTLTRYVDFWDAVTFVNTEGTAVTVKKPRVGLALRPLASDGRTVQMALKNFGGIVGFNHLLGREEEVERLANHAASLLDAEPVRGGIYDVITDPILTGIFAHEAFGHTAEADEIFADEKLQEIMKPGRRFGSEVLSIIDDATCVGHAGYVPYDDEGVRGQKKYLLREGVLVNLLHNRETAARMGAEPTGNARALDYRFPPIIRMTATYVAPGESTLDEMLAAVKKGIYARGAKGGTGGETFSFTAEDGYLIENGKLTTHLRDVKLQGNLFQTLANIEMVGKDFTLPEEGAGGCGKGYQAPLPVSSGGPHMLIRGVQIGGR